MRFGFRFTIPPYHTRSRKQPIELKWVEGTVYYVPRPDAPELYSMETFRGDDTDMHRSTNKLMFSTQDEAIRCAEHMLGY